MAVYLQFNQSEQKQLTFELLPTKIKISLYNIKLEECKPRNLQLTPIFYVVAHNVNHVEKLRHKLSYNASSSETGSTVAWDGMEFTM